jgi:MYXO-CTERM domain-containing protein
LSLRPLALLAIAASTAACGVPQPPEPLGYVEQAQGGCGVERWSVKTGTDSDIGTVNFVPQDLSVLTANGFPIPTTYPDTNRIAPWEEQVFRFRDVRLTEYKLETDSDYHLVIWDCALQNHLIAEIPAPGCVGSTSAFLAGINSARATFDAQHTPSASFQPANDVISFIGSGFFDVPHGQTGAAVNNFEIHAVLGICFGTGCTANGVVPDGGTTTGYVPCTPMPSSDGGTDAGVSGGPKAGCGCQSGETAWLAAPLLLLLALQRVRQLRHPGEAHARGAHRRVHRGGDARQR